MQSFSRMCILVFDHSKLQPGVNFLVLYFDRFLTNPELLFSREPEFWKRQAY